VAAALGDLLQVTVKQEYLGQQILNVYHYRVTSITGLAGNYLELLAQFVDSTINDAVAQFQVNSLVYTEAEARNLSNGLDFHVEPLTRTGDRTDSGSNAVPSFVSAGFQLIRESLATRNGYKRYAGLDDTLLVNNSYLIGSTIQGDVEDALAADWVEALVTVGEPIIWGSPRANPPVGSYIYSSIGSAIYREVGTQNTRKPGRGV
jgi:hypothetical protein